MSKKPYEPHVNGKIRWYFMSRRGKRWDYVKPSGYNQYDI